MNRPEQAIHLACAQFLDLKRNLPGDALWWHTGNGGFRRPREAAILKALGVKPGIPDILLLHEGQLIGVELKAEGGRLTPAQTVMHDRLIRAGAAVTTAMSLDAMADFIGLHMPLRASLTGGQ